MPSVLFDLGSTYSYFALVLDLICNMLDAFIMLLPLVGECCSDQLYHSCFVMFMGLQIWVDFVILNMIDFDVLLGMTWLYLYHFVLNCDSKTITLEISIILN